MSVKVVRTNYTMRNSRGTIVLPSWCLEGLNNLKVPDVYAQDSVQQYPLGAQLCKDDKIYRYVKAGADSTHIAMLKVNANYEPGATGHENDDGFEGGLATGHAVVAGDTVIYIADLTHTARPENYYEGGELVLEYDAGGFIHQYRIVASDAGYASTYVKLYIAEPGAKTACPVSGTVVDAYASRFSNIKSAIDSSLNCDLFTAMGACGMAVTSGYFFWLQSGGLITLNGTAGYTLGHRMVYPNTDGSVLETEHVAGGQEVGYVVGATISGYGTLQVFLTIDR